MQSIHLAITINRRIEDVFDYVTDITRDPEWFSGVKTVRTVSVVERGAGAEFEQDILLFGWRYTQRMRVTDYVPPGRMTLLCTKSAIPFSATYRFEPANHGTGTLVMLDAHVIGSSFYRLLGPAFLPMLRSAVRRRFLVLKRILEHASLR